MNNAKTVLLVTIKTNWGTQIVQNASMEPMLKQVDLLSAHRVQQEDIVLKAA
jgi:hypothetical protein